MNDAIATNTQLKLPMSMVIIYLVTYAIWRQLVFGNYSFVYFRLLFLAAIVIYLIRGQGWVAVKQEMARALALPKGKTRFCMQLVGVALLLRLLVKVIWPEVVIGLEWATMMDECLLPPLSEEIVFRWLLLGALLQNMKSSTWAVMLSAFLFASAHNLSGPLHLVPLLALGLITSYGYLKTGSLSFCIVLHALWNALVFIGVYVSI